MNSRLCSTYCRHLTTISISVLILIQMSTLWAATTPSTTARTRIPADFNKLPGPQAVQPIPMEVLDPNPESVRIRFTNPPLEFDQSTFGGVAYNTVRLSGEAATLDPGEPDVPRVTRLIMVHNTGNVELTVMNQSFTLQNGFFPAPRQAAEGESGNLDDGTTGPKSEIYAANQWYPRNIAEVSEPATLRDVRFVILTIYPVQVNPVTREMRVYDDIEVQISNIGGVGANEIRFTPTSVSPDFKKLYTSFENFRGSSLDELPVLPGKYLVICGPLGTSDLAYVQKLVDWKRRRGIDASYVTTSTTGTSYTNIKSYISSQYTASNGTLEAVCLIGDPSGASGYLLDTHGSQYDNYFGTMTDGNPDPVPDIAVGRLSATSTSYLQAIINKTIYYESDPDDSDPDWFTRAWCASNTAHVPSNPSTKQYTRQIMLQHGASTVYWNVYSGDVLEADVISRLTSGVSVFNHRMSWLSEIGPSELDQLPTNGKLPFVMAITCGTGNFIGVSPGTSEYWLFPANQTPTIPKGAIGCVGMYGSGTHVPYNNIVDAGTMYGLYVQDIQQQGVALITGKLELYRNYWAYGHSGDVNNFCYWANLMGDPGVPVWRKQPLVSSVTKPSSINLGTNNVAMTVQQSGSPVEDAYVCLLKGSETFARGYTDATGQINLPCSTATTGYMYVTITKDDMMPYLDSINVVTATASLAHFSTYVDDDNSGGTTGDNNHVINPGETIDLRIALRNAGTTTTVTGISGTLTTSSPGIQITQASSTYPNLTPGANANPNTSFRIHVSSVFNAEPSTFFLEVTSSIGAQQIRVDLTPAAGDVAYTTYGFWGPGGNLDPGESGELTVAFQNTGTRSLVSSTGILRSFDAYLSVTDSAGTFGTVAASGSASNTTNTFGIAMSSATYNGHRAPMQLVITDANGFRDSVDFVLVIGTQTATSPTGPDAYGYYAFDNTESQPPNSGSTYEWIEICPSLGGSGTSMNFTDVAEDGDLSAARTLPFNFVFYGQTFSEITICSNGWIAFGNYAIDDFRNYRMGSPLGPPNQVAAYWDDLVVSGSSNNVYYWYNSTDHYYVVEWRAQTLWTGVNEYFEIILYDPEYYPSSTGDGKIKVQYQQVNLSPNQDNSGTDNLYSSVGIQNADHSIGLDYYYWNQYSAGSATLTAGRSIMFSTDASGQLFSIITVNQPNGGENWYIAQPYNILWQSTAVNGPVDVSINRNYPSGAWETIVSGTANDGVYQWTVTGSQSTANARIRVISVEEPTIGDTSDANFSITMPTVTLLEPNGGEFWGTDSLVYITWTSEGLGAVAVHLNRDYPSGTWEVLSPSSDVGLLWTTTGPATASARVRVVGLSIATVGDTSDANFMIDSPPIIVHSGHADQGLGSASFITQVYDDGPGFVTKLFYRITGSANYDSVTFSATGNPDEFIATTTALSAGQYEYYIRSTDPQSISSFYPESGTLTFDVGPLCDSWIIYDDGTSENYNWVNGPDFQWAVKFEPESYPFTLCAGRFAVNPVAPTDDHDPIIFRVIAADGTDGAPGTLLFIDTTGAPGNVAGGLPSGPAWADVITQVGGQPLQLNAPFYLSVQNLEPRTHPSSFAHDTVGTRSHQSYYYDGCEGEWISEDAATESARPGNRMIRASGFSLSPVEVVISRVDSSGIVSSRLRWISTGAPYYRIYSATNGNGPFDTLVASVPGAAYGVAMTYTDVNAVALQIRKFYFVKASDTP